MSLWDSAERWLAEHRLIGMSRDDVEAWESAYSLVELGGNTALWLDGVIKSQPGYLPRCGPDPETTEITGVLATINRLGFVTDGSQPGEREELVPPPADQQRCAAHEMADGFFYEQRAAVEGWADDAMTDKLRVLAQDNRFHFIAQKPRLIWGWGRDYGLAVPVTRIVRPDTEIVRVETCFGAQRSRNEVERAWYPCNPVMIRKILASWSVTIVDDEWGPSERLWKALREL
jgi:hypothetical protein